MGLADVKDAQCYGYDGAIWRRMLVDAFGHLQIDVLSSALPSGAATSGRQDTMIAQLGGGLPSALYLDSVKSSVYGFNGANLSQLRVESVTYPNLKVGLFNGANQVTVGQITGSSNSYDIALAVKAQMMLDHVTNGLALPVQTPAYTGDAADGQHEVPAALYGYNGSTWDRLRTESDSAMNLRVKLFDGANGIDSSDAVATSALTVRGLWTQAILRASTGTGYGVLYGYSPNVDAVGTASRALHAQGLMYGFNGTTWDRLRVESNTAFNLRVKLYDGANGIDSTLLDGVSMPDTMRGFPTKAGLSLWDSYINGWRAVSVAYRVGDAQVGYSQLPVFIYGFNGSTYDRLRTYGTGVLKVGRAEIDSTTTRLIAAGQVVAGAHNLYWLSCNPSAGNSVFELSDDLDGLSAIVMDCFSTTREGKGFNFDPPIKFATGIYLKTFTAMTSCTFCYV